LKSGSKCDTLDNLGKVKNPGPEAPPRAAFDFAPEDQVFNVGITLIEEGFCQEREGNPNPEEQ
jgi:hypothetical protein